MYFFKWLNCSQVILKNIDPEIVDLILIELFTRSHTYSSFIDVIFLDHLCADQHGLITKFIDVIHRLHTHYVHSTERSHFHLCTDHLNFVNTFNIGNLIKNFLQQITAILIKDSKHSHFVLC